QSAASRGSRARVRGAGGAPGPPGRRGAGGGWAIPAWAGSASAVGAIYPRLSRVGPGGSRSSRAGAVNGAIRWRTRFVGVLQQLVNDRGDDLASVRSEVALVEEHRAAHSRGGPVCRAKDREEIEEGHAEDTTDLLQALLRVVVEQHGLDLMTNGERDYDELESVLVREPGEFRQQALQLRPHVGAEGAAPVLEMPEHLPLELLGRSVRE